jgi:hypothetical protein
MKNTLKILSNLLIIAPTLAGIYEPHTTWDKLELETCFYSEESHLKETRIESIAKAKEKFDFVPKRLSKRKRARVVDAVKKDFTPSRTGITFVGFKDCSQVANPDVVVMRAGSKVFLLDTPGFGGRAVIGQDGVMSIHSSLGLGFYKKSGKIGNVILKNVRPSTIIHEFGHVAGLRHEHIHQDAQLDKNCHKFVTPLKMDEPDKLEQPFATTVFHTEYDSKSIMNYCNTFVNRRDLDKADGPILSAKDRRTLKEIYPTESNQNKDNQ